MKRLSLIPVLVFILFARNITVKKVYTGDSMESTNGESIKLLGVVCPVPSYPFGQEALALTRSLLEGRRINLQFDDVELTDSVGIIYSYVHLICDTCVEAKFENQPGEQNVISIQAPLIPVCDLLLKKGLASVDSTKNFGQLPYFRFLQKKAKKQKVGMWKDK